MYWLWAWVGLHPHVKDKLPPSILASRGSCPAILEEAFSSVPRSPATNWPRQAVRTVHRVSTVVKLTSDRPLPFILVLKKLCPSIHDEACSSVIQVVRFKLVLGQEKKITGFSGTFLKKIMREGRFLFYFFSANQYVWYEYLLWFQTNYWIIMYTNIHEYAHTVCYTQ